jgi:hypothetical protein
MIIGPMPHLLTSACGHRIISLQRSYFVALGCEADIEQGRPLTHREGAKNCA